MSKEEILENNKVIVKGSGVQRIPGLYKSMDEYAKEQSIAFAQWMIDNDYVDPEDFYPIFLKEQTTLTT